jgi:hypothetical protein
MDDVIRVIKIHRLPQDYSNDLHEYVRAEFQRVWNLAQIKDRDEE